MTRFGDKLSGYSGHGGANMIWFIVGLFVGGFLGVLGMCILILVAGRD